MTTAGSRKQEVERRKKVDESRAKKELRMEKKE